MTNSEYSADPYEDGTVPADADMATSGADGATAEQADGHTRTDGETFDDSNPEALVEGNRVATAGDMDPADGSSLDDVPAGHGTDDGSQNPPLPDGGPTDGNHGEDEPATR